ncbi:hypothetical protein EB796_017645 [Bugula neritina]|uniref:Replication factor A C-terminal domain-containing protein n=1 Tax=Bugula neritina TaxID=10212 RepID=A0A7J7JCP3_BUGNE|nr:hypothetical protein EB796_017645 [Bugula neritina]
MVEKTFTKFGDYNKRLYCDKCQDSCQPTNHLLKYKLSMKVCDLTSRLIYRLTVFGKSLESVIGCSAHHYKQIEELNQDKMAAKKIYHMLLHCLLGKLFNVNITKRFGMNTTLPTMYGKDFMVQGFDSEQTLIKQLQSHFDVGITDFNTKLKFGNQVNNCSRLPYTSSNYGATFTLCSDTRTMSILLVVSRILTHTLTIVPCMLAVVLSRLLEKSLLLYRLVR